MNDKKLTLLKCKILKKLCEVYIYIFIIIIIIIEDLKN